MEEEVWLQHGDRVRCFDLTQDGHLDVHSIATSWRLDPSTFFIEDRHVKISDGGRSVRRISNFRSAERDGNSKEKALHLEAQPVVHLNAGVQGTGNKMAMQQMMNDEPVNEEVLRESQCAYLPDSQVSSPSLPVYSQPQVYNGHSFAPMFPSASPFFFRMLSTLPHHHGFQVHTPNEGNQFRAQVESNQPNQPVESIQEQPKVVSSSKRGAKRGNKAEQEDGGHGRQPAKKRGRPKKKVIHVDGVKDEGGTEGGKREIWKDSWAISLCHERGGLNDEFSKPQKQGHDLWSKIANKLAATYSDFHKDSEACRKKWGRLFDLYKADRLHNSISGNDIQKTCKWYDIVDEYMHEHAHVRLCGHTSATVQSTVTEYSEVDPSSPNEANSSNPALQALNKASLGLGGRSGRKDAQMEIR